MEAFLISTGIVALAEVGDKTQLLAFVLAARYRGAAVPIILGILVATLVNHAFAAIIGAWLAAVVPAEVLRWVLGLSFIGMGIWVLIPDKLEEKDTQFPRLGVFGVTLVAFFLAEMGDKTQVATAALAAQYSAFVPVVMGTTLGMMIANVPAVFMGERLTTPAIVKVVHAVAAVLFVLLGVAALTGLDAYFGF
ncbi:TMEM165/GDT1 family protein [Marinimicrobium sp. ABcell2]|uniref:TMEM165/GDT1 family protein n=1 Tax=Marinimicrobium sp. ABcell2 TaxID=3069751 RepID=UPI0027B54048|nr:TMEM165/GDT1 family protein [Marinimicrobium sp. ABcell2]MDQ2076867.1 TMEM165/GDT1 family protein [Marinimicrobium sp. ABcell2]